MSTTEPLLNLKPTSNFILNLTIIFGKLKLLNCRDKHFYRVFQWRQFCEVRHKSRHCRRPEVAVNLGRDFRGQSAGTFLCLHDVPGVG